MKKLLITLLFLGSSLHAASSFSSGGCRSVSFSSTRSVSLSSTRMSSTSFSKVSSSSSIKPSSISYSRSSSYSNPNSFKSYSYRPYYSYGGFGYMYHPYYSYSPFNNMWFWMYMMNNNNHHDYNVFSQTNSLDNWGGNEDEEEHQPAYSDSTVITIFAVSVFILIAILVFCAI